MNLEDVLEGAWYGHYHDCFGKICRVYLDVVKVLNSFSGKVRLEIISLHGIEQLGGVVDVSYDSDKVYFTSIIEGKELLTQGQFVNTKGFFEICSLYGATNSLELEHWAGGSWILWRIDDPQSSNAEASVK
jgi:hypothetical protein